MEAAEAGEHRGMGGHEPRQLGVQAAGLPVEGPFPFHDGLLLDHAGGGGHDEEADDEHGGGRSPGEAGPPVRSEHGQRVDRRPKPVRSLNSS